MTYALVIVESPAKAKTINRYLGDGYKVLASNGHVRDLLPKSGAVDPENNFEMHYQAIEKNNKSIKAIRDALKKSRPSKAISTPSLIPAQSTSLAR